MTQRFGLFLRPATAHWSQSRPETVRSRTPGIAPERLDRWLLNEHYVVESTLLYSTRMMLIDVNSRRARSVIVVQKMQFSIASADRFLPAEHSHRHSDEAIVAKPGFSTP